jgi:hypothetical protein
MSAMLGLAALYCGDAAAMVQAAPESPSAAVPPAAPQAGTARIRVFGQNGTTVRFYEDSACFGGKAKETQVSGGVGDAFSSFIGTAKNTSIGIRDTPTTTGIKRRDGYFAKAYFREYAIKSGQPLTVWMRYQSNPGNAYAACGAIGGTFTPESDKDYEVSLDQAGGRCLAVIREVADAGDGSAQLRDVSVARTTECR